MKQTILGTIFSLAILLGACAPATDRGAEPVVAVINGPQQAQVEGPAPAFTEAIRRIGTPGFVVLRDVALAGIEKRRDLGGSQAIPSAARIARSFGARFTLMLGAVEVEREVFETRGEEVRIVIDLVVEGILVRGSDQRVVATIRSRTFTGERFAPAAADLPELLRDPTTEQLARRAAASLAPAFREAIASQLNESNSE